MGLFALHDVSAGTEVLREEALMKGHRDDLAKEALFAVLSESKKARFLALCGQCKCPPSASASTSAMHQHSHTDSESCAHSDETEKESEKEESKEVKCTETPVAKILNVNYFEAPLVIPSDKYSGPYIYEFASRINHSCIPNTTRGFSSSYFPDQDGHIIFVALRDIKEGDEITTDYLSAAGTTEQRRELLKEHHGFVCGCQACVDGVDIDDDVAAKGVLLNVNEYTNPVIGRHSEEEKKLNRKVDEW